MGLVERWVCPSNAQVLAAYLWCCGSNVASMGVEKVRASIEPFRRPLFFALWVCDTMARRSGAPRCCAHS
eukprot:1159375-Pelagomonas_calceolata.AAC.4